ncbi:MAG: hypothetical protein N0C84_00780 [Candidatus Thiodiazotropha taylori]|uniref:Uncharacterized protein n=1 Tax=Candidatus Thiodiazotropha taylori TaxID=2792791 RepID=A0A9E4N354_9GAMM|nr:hypothetical protein [Candidatus Thiodiazotropha taylori]MCW4254980.1 hypothetical protein [Candidatus Thiodiazotropha taylori]
MIIVPQDLEKAATDIVRFWQSSELRDEDKIKILEMVNRFYSDKNEYIHDQYLAELTKRMLDKHNPQTGFEVDEISEE